MQPKTEEPLAELEPYGIAKSQPKSFELYEEYSQRDINETIRTRQDYYQKANPQAWEEIKTEVEIEAENFRLWLEVVKKLQPFSAHYYSVSLKSLLLGLPIGVHFALLFDVVLDKKNPKRARACEAVQK